MSAPPSDSPVKLWSEVEDAALGKSRGDGAAEKGAGSSKGAGDARQQTLQTNNQLFH